jgi:hypothetical protein
MSGIDIDSYGVLIFSRCENTDSEIPIPMGFLLKLSIRVAEHTDSQSGYTDSF